MRKLTYDELESRVKALEAELQRVQKAEQDIREAEMQCKFFMNTVPDIVYRLDKEGNIIQINKAVEKYGYEIEEVRGSYHSCGRRRGPCQKFYRGDIE